MSFSTTKISGAKEDLHVFVPSLGEAVGAGATPETDVADQATNTPPHVLFGAAVDCSDNPNEDVTLRLYNTAGTPTVGTDVAHVWLPGTRGKIVEYEFPMGLRFGTGMAVAVVKGKGGTTGAVDPSGTVRVTLRILGTAAGAYA